MAKQRVKILAYDMSKKPPVAIFCVTLAMDPADAAYTLSRKLPMVLALRQKGGNRGKPKAKVTPDAESSVEGGGE